MPIASRPMRIPSMDMNALHPSGALAAGHRQMTFGRPFGADYTASCKRNRAAISAGDALACQSPASGASHRSSLRVAAPQEVGCRVVRLLAGRLGHRRGKTLLLLDH